MSDLAETMNDEPVSPPMMDISDQARIVEAVLFASPEPMTVAALRNAIPGDSDLGAALAELQTIYAGRGIALKEIDGRWAFRTSDLVAPHLRKFRREEKKISRAGLETLAIIAYHQPVTRTEIENIRGVVISKGTLDILMELGWIKPGRRREIPGRPLTWITTPEFMDHFGLEKLQDLPGMDDLKASGLLDTRPAIETVDLFGAIAEGEDKPEDEDAEDIELRTSTETRAAIEDDIAPAEGEDDDESDDEDSDDDIEDSDDDDDDDDDDETDDRDDDE